MIERPTRSAEAIAGWSQDRIDELNANGANGHVGDKLVSETEHVRVWHLRIIRRL